MAVAEHAPVAQFIRHAPAPFAVTLRRLPQAPTTRAGLPAFAGTERFPSLFEKGTR